MKRIEKLYEILKIDEEGSRVFEMADRYCPHEWQIDQYCDKNRYDGNCFKCWMAECGEETEEVDNDIR